MAELMSNSKHVELANCDDLSTLERPEAVNSLLIDWLEESTHGESSYEH